MNKILILISIILIPIILIYYTDYTDFTDFTDCDKFPSSTNVVRHLKQFLSPYEVSHIINLAKKNFDKFEKSYTIDKETGEYVYINGRTSKTLFLDKGHDQIIKNIEKRASEYSNIPIDNIENIQIVKYEPGEFYKEHYDSFEDNYAKKNGQRVVTFFVYLNDDFEGGTTYFPKLNKNFKGNPGDAFFWINTINGKIDKRTLHSGTKLLSGTKYGMNIWLCDSKYC